MRHKKKKKRIKGHNLGHRKAIIRSLLSSLFTYQKIKTTVAKAKEARRAADKLISLAKRPAVHTRRQAFKILQDRSLVKKLFTEIAPEFERRLGGYTRLIRISSRSGDGAEMALLELTELVAAKKTKPKKSKSKDKETVAREEIKPKAKEKKPEQKKTKGFLRGLRKYLKTDH